MMDSALQSLSSEQVTWSAIVVWLIQKAKSSRFVPMVTERSAGVNRMAAILMAAITAAGIHFTFDAGTLTVTGLTIANAAHVAGEVIRAIVFQELIYRGAVK